MITGLPDHKDAGILDRTSHSECIQSFVAFKEELFGEVGSLGGGGAPQ